MIRIFPKVFATALAVAMVISGEDALFRSNAGFNIFMAWPDASCFERFSLVGVGLLGLAILGVLAFFGLKVHRHWCELFPVNKMGVYGEQLVVLYVALVILAALRYQGIVPFDIEHPNAGWAETFLAMRAEGFLPLMQFCAGCFVTAIFAFVVGMSCVFLGMAGSFVWGVIKAVCEAGQPPQPRRW